MPTDDQIFAGPIAEFNLENIIQVARTNRNVDIVKKFNAQHPGNHIHISTVGARISRSLDIVAKKAGRRREEYKEEFEAERMRNGVGGRNQHTLAGKKRPAEEVDEGDDGAETAAASPTPEAETARPRKLRKRAPATEQQRRDSVAASTASPSPLPKKSKRAASSVSLPPAAAGKKRDREEAGEAGEADSQRNSRPQKSAKTSSSGSGSSSGSQESSKSGSGKATTSQRQNGGGAPGDDSPSSNSSSGLGSRSATPSPPAKSQVSDEEESDEEESASDQERVRRFSEQLDDAEAATIFADSALINDDRIIELAQKKTVREIVRSANRGSRPRRYSAPTMMKRINGALRNLAERKGRSVVEMRAKLNADRMGNGIEPGGQARRKASKASKA